MQSIPSSRLSYVSHALLPGLLGVSMSGCGGGGGGTTASTGTPTYDNPLDARVLWCGWKEPGNPGFTHGKKFCITTGACTSPPSALCAYNVDGTESTYEKYTADGPDGEGFAQWDGLCNEECPSEVEAGRATPYCEGVDPSPYDPNVYGACEPPEETTGGPTTGATTTSETTTGDDSAGTDSDGPYIEVWLCSESAHENCQDRSGSGILATDDQCWSTSMTTSRCVNAATEAEAEAACECLCDIQDSIYSNACDSPGVCQVDAHFDCAAPYPDNPKPLGLTTHLCEGNILNWDAAAGMCPGNFKPFNASASLILADGTSTAVTGIAGYLHYTVSGCSGDTCDFELDVLEIPAADMTGVYVQAGTVGGTYALEDIALHMKDSVEGTWWSPRQTVTFNGNRFWAKATMTAVSVDSVAIPAGPVTIGTTQVVGDLDPTTSVLTLNFSFAVPGGTASLALTTY
jgi:hypothetical protein